MPLQTFRYAACGGGNTLLGFLVFTVLLRFVFVQETVSFSIVVLKSHKAALILSSCCSFVIGFILNKYVVFTNSTMKGNVQLFRYFLSFISNLCIAAALQTLFVDFMHIDAYIAQAIILIIIITISYLTQKYFSFREVR